MCLGAIYWSRIGRAYFAVDRHDAAGIEFRDEFICEDLVKPPDERRWRWSTSGATTRSTSSPFGTTVQIASPTG